MGKQTPPNKGIKTQETTIVACQCGCATFEVKKRLKTAVNLACTKCGLATSVKGNIATVRVKDTEVAYALKNTCTGPDPDAEPGKKGAGKKKKKEDTKYKLLRFRILEEQDSTIRRAMEIVRVMNNSDPKFRDQAWQGHALEFVCADFISGAPPETLAVVDAMDEAAEEAEKKAEADGRSPAATQRRIRNARAKVRDRMAGDLAQQDFFDGVATDTAQDEQADTGEEEEGFQVPDDGRLKKGLLAALGGYQEEVKAKEDVDIDYLIVERDDAKDAMDRWEGLGGYLLRVMGDERTVDENDFRKELVVWISHDFPDVFVDLGLDYSEAMDDLLPDANLEVIQIVKGKLDALASYADKKEILK